MFTQIQFFYLSISVLKSVLISALVLFLEQLWFRYQLKPKVKFWYFWYQPNLDLDQSLVKWLLDLLDRSLFNQFIRPKNFVYQNRDTCENTVIIVFRFTLTI